MPGGHVIVFGKNCVGKALVMAQIEIRFGPVIGDIDLTVLIGAHRSGVDVYIGIEFHDSNLKTVALQQTTDAGGGDSFA